MASTALIRTREALAKARTKARDAQGSVMTSAVAGGVTLAGVGAAGILDQRMGTGTAQLAAVGLAVAGLAFKQPLLISAAVGCAANSVYMRAAAFGATTIGSATTGPDGKPIQTPVPPAPAVAPVAK